MGRRKKEDTLRLIVAAGVAKTERIAQAQACYELAIRDARLNCRHRWKGYSGTPYDSAGECCSICGVDREEVK